MDVSTARDESFEHDAHALRQLWAEVPREAVTSRARIDALVIAATARGDRRLAVLSCAFEAIDLVYVSSRAYEPDVDLRLEALSNEVVGFGWQRAIDLLGAALAFRAHFLRGDIHQSLERLDRQGPASHDPRPAAERFWTDAFACILHGAVGNFEAALQAGLVANRLAEDSQLDWCIVTAQHALAYCFLRIGDVDSAAAVVPIALAAEARIGRGRRPRGILYNQLLSLALSGQTAGARELIDANPSLMERDFMAGSPLLRCLVAYVFSLQGEHERALAVLEADAHPPEFPREEPELSANRAWMAAAVWQRAGQSARARLALEAFQHHSVDQGWSISPLNRTMLMRVFSEVCEAEGDLRGALDALKLSQEACFQWVAGSVRIRLQALHLQSPAVRVDANRLTKRLDAVASASSTANDLPTRSRSARHLAHVTHEMRNPLNGVLGITALLALSDLDERQRKYVAVMESSAQMLLALCNDTLDLAKIEAGKFDLNPQPTDVVGLLREAVRLYEHQVHQRSVALLLNLDPALPPTLLVDRLRLQQVLMNLLGNAAKFTRRGSITVEAHWSLAASGHSGRLHVTVSDTGPGLDASQRARLFQEFSQGDATVAEHYGGTGLGLALCRNLVELMGGEIDVDSEPGRGSNFWFELPLTVVQSPVLNEEKAVKPPMRQH